MEPNTNSHSEKITEALELLNEAAREKKDEFRDLISQKYVHLKESLTSADIKHSLDTARKNAVEAAAKARNISEEKMKVLATEVDKNVHANPWPYVGGVAVGALLLGYILGKKN